MKCLPNPLLFYFLLSASHAFTIVQPHSQIISSTITTNLRAKEDIIGGVEEYKNVATSILSNFMQKDVMKDDTPTLLDSINFDAPKFQKVKLELLAQILDAELYDKEWFVTGNVNPIYFSTDFEFQDPDVKLSGIDEYAKGVAKLFDETSRAEIISTVVNPDLGENIITCTWRLSGRVKIGPGDGLTIKPYIVYTDFTVNTESGLVVRQEDRFDIPGWDILLSALFPFLIGKVTKEAAPPVVTREVPTLPNFMSGIRKIGAGGFDFSNIAEQFFK